MISKKSKGISTFDNLKEEDRDKKSAYERF